MPSTDQEYSLAKQLEYNLYTLVNLLDFLKKKEPIATFSMIYKPVTK